MRCSLSILTIFLAGFCLAQSPGTEADPNAVRPDVIVYVHGDPTGADLVRISMVDPKYPAETLQKQVNDLCAKLGEAPRALTIATYEMESVSGLKFLQANFGTVGLTDSDGNANLAPLIQAFAGAPEPFTIHGMEVFYSDFDPPVKGPKDFTSSAVVVRGRMDNDPPQVEYSIKLLSQNPGEIMVSTKPPRAEPKVNQAPPAKSTPVLVWCLILIGGLAAGALVYFLLAKRLSGSSSPSVLRK
jgi:hypothetical protein